MIFKWELFDLEMFINERIFFSFFISFIKIILIIPTNKTKHSHEKSALYLLSPLASICEGHQHFSIHASAGTQSQPRPPFSIRHSRKSVFCARNAMKMKEMATCAVRVATCPSGVIIRIA